MLYSSYRVPNVVVEIGTEAGPFSRLKQVSSVMYFILDSCSTSCKVVYNLNVTPWKLCAKIMEHTGLVKLILFHKRWRKIYTYVILLPWFLGKKLLNLLQIHHFHNYFQLLAWNSQECFAKLRVSRWSNNEMKLMKEKTSYSCFPRNSRNSRLVVFIL